MKKVCFLIGLMIIPVSARLHGQTATITSTDTSVCLGDAAPAYLQFNGHVGPWSAVINDRSGEYLVLEKVVSTDTTIWLSPDSTNIFTLGEVKDSAGNEASVFGSVPLSVYEATPVDIVSDRTVFLVSETGVPLISSPSGGVFFGPGVAGNVFYPRIANAEGSPHTITCTYTNPFGCTSSTTTQFRVLSGEAAVYLVSGEDTINTVCDDGASYTLLGSNRDEIPGTFAVVEAETSDTIESPVTDEDPADDQAMFNPAGLSGTYDVLYGYRLEQVKVTVSLRILVNDLGEIVISGLPDTVCMNDEPYLMVPDLSGDDPGATYVFNGPGVTGSQDGGFFYNPAEEEVTPGTVEIELEYTSSNGCRAGTVRPVYNSRVPDVAFTLRSVCLPSDGGTVSFSNLTDSMEQISSWIWDFGDPGSGDDNFSDLAEPEHFYRTAGEREISLEAVTSEGCVADFTLDTMIADEPIADFTLLNDCFTSGQITRMIDRSVSEFSEVDTLVWTLRSRGGQLIEVIGSSLPEDTLQYGFSAATTYQVELYVENVAGCGGSTVREVTLKPTILLQADGYLEDFNEQAEHWVPVSEGAERSWTLGIPDFEGFNPMAADRGWYTDLPVTDGYLEQSWVESPCFDLRFMNNPQVQLDLMKSFAPGTDGAVLQYTDLTSGEWQTIGQISDGLNWYNMGGLLNEPGGSSFGWGMALFEPDREWVRAAQSVDMLAGKQQVKLRLAVATRGSEEVITGAYNQGFAFDNFFIGEKKRCSLLEHFTNSGSFASLAADSVVDSVAAIHSYLIDIQYHMDYPGADPMNENNPLPASTRSFRYGVPRVPFALFNGGVQDEYRFDFSSPEHYPSEEIIEHARLEMPLFSLGLTVDYGANSLSAEVEITCETDTFDSNLQLYVALLEREVTAYTGVNQDTSFRNVVLDMLPTPAGKLLGAGWNLGRTERQPYSWEYPDFLEDVEDLSVVAFVQDRDGGEVLQAIQKPLTPGVGLRKRLPEPASLALYPNPARDQVYLNFGKDLRSTGILRCTDLSGREVWNRDLQPGYQIYRMDVTGLPEGIYLIHWIESGTVRCRGKLLIQQP